MNEDKKTCLYDRHVALGALMSPFGGFIMPDTIQRHSGRTQCRQERMRVFDVSHMGEVSVIGPDAEKFVNHIFTNDVTPGQPGQCFYGMMLNENGGIVDDLLVYKNGTDDYFLVINASNIAKDVAWIETQAKILT